MSKINLELKARHFNGTVFFLEVEGTKEEATRTLVNRGFKNEEPHCIGCAIELAASELFSGKSVKEHVWELKIEGEAYDHPEYNPKDFWDDKERAKQLGYDDTLIRVIKCTKKEAE